MKITEKQISGAVILVLILAMIALVVFWANNRNTRIGPEYETGSGGSAGCTGDSFVTTETETGCAAERVLTGTANQVTVTDNGANSTIVLSLPQSIATTSDVTFDDIVSTGVFGIESVNEFLTLAAPATIRLGGRDNIIIELDTNANSASDFCIRANNVASDIFCIDESGNVTLATIDGDLNTFVDIKPDSFDSIDAGVDEECLTYEGTNTVEWQPCGSGSFDLPFGLPIADGSSPTTTAYIGVPGAVIYSGGAQFVTANDIYYEPFRVTAAAGITINRLSFEVTSAGNPGDSCRVGIYEMDSEGQPVDLVDDSGTAANDTTGWKHISDTIVLSPGEYLKALVCNTGPALYSHNTAGLTQGAVNSGTTSATRNIRARRDSAPAGTPHASGFANPSDSPWETLDLINIGSEGHFILLRWSLN